MAITKFEATTSVFAGQGDLVMFDAPADWAAAAYASLANPKSLGQIVQDSTEWSGEDPETTEIKDEQGNIITAKVSAGTLGFAFDIASTSKEMIKAFLVGEDVTLTANTTLEAAGTVTAVGFGVELPTMTRPLMIVSDDKTKAWLYPKSKITSSLAYSDGLWRIHATVVCEYLDLETLKTAMILFAAANKKFE